MIIDSLREPITFSHHQANSLSCIFLASLARLARLARDAAHKSLASSRVQFLPLDRPTDTQAEARGKS
jgi:hypothetical protein